MQSIDQLRFESLVNLFLCEFLLAQSHAARVSYVGLGDLTPQAFGETALRAGPSLLSLWQEMDIDRNPVQGEIACRGARHIRDPNPEVGIR